MIYEHKDNIGKIFILLGVFALVYMFLSPLNNVFIHPDEYFTFGLINYSFQDILTTTATDVHPPMYYFILKSVLEAVSLTGLNVSTLFLTKIVSIIPYGLMLIVSILKLRKDYGWLSSGIFIFSVGVMTDFLVQYSTIRMYTWGMFFLFMAFIYFGEIITNSDYKNWILFTAFSLLVAYTQYFIAISVGCIYLCLLFYIIKFDKKELKMFFASVTGFIVLYIPWIPFLLRQITRVNSSWWIPPVDIELALNSSVYYLTSANFIPLKILAIITTVFIIILAFKRYYEDAGVENYFILSGIIVFFATLVLAILVSVIFKPMLIYRYLIPVSSLIWLSIAILIGKINNEKIFTILLIVILIFAVSGAALANSDIGHLEKKGEKWDKMFNKINSGNDTIVIHDGEVGIYQFESFLNNTHSYSPHLNTIIGVDNSTLHGLYEFEEKSPSELNRIISEKNDSDIYYISAWGSFEVDKSKLHEIGKVGDAHFYKIR